MLSSEHEHDFTFARDDIAILRGARILVSGGTGFVGSWFLELVAWANRRCDARIALVVISRDPEKYLQTRPHLASAEFVTLLRGDVRTVDPTGSFDAVIHAATDASAEELRLAPGRLVETIVRGGEVMLGIAARSGPIPFLLTSSGAVYGARPLGSPNIAEDARTAPDPLDPSSAYAEGKRFAELQCSLAALVSEIRPKIARLFAFVGPYLPLDRHFAIGNFIADALAGRPIRILGDGSPIRSYLYGSDLAVWLAAILVRGVPLRAYNVGSESPYTLRELSTLIAQICGGPAVEIRGGIIAGVGSSYVPATNRAREELGVAERIGLETAVRRSIAYHRNMGDLSHPV